ncbi:hypothetical protein NEOLI_000925 [Neolecta irregularis DAH-3]|uniref:Uncharacterized protein n=1 Tax=Neolecta irregularis (strain DAH-3) TaxID=1198029 RepID=A0A1U7LW51_NEOID|nr:hypothetical protein NEOLI_000925 [Neolecta irregularis DAH-3]|eukprot:OLL26849.1 hypothetical protein NEOLI_000925 [Neolecta irregularis DAH-3]
MPEIPRSKSLGAMELEEMNVFLRKQPRRYSANTQALRREAVAQHRPEWVREALEARNRQLHASIVVREPTPDPSEKTRKLCFCIIT